MNKDKKAITTTRITSAHDCNYNYRYQNNHNDKKFFFIKISFSAINKQ